MYNSDFQSCIVVAFNLEHVEIILINICLGVTYKKQS